MGQVSSKGSPADIAAGSHFDQFEGAAHSATRRRRGFSTRWLGDDATYAVRSGPTSPLFPELEGILRHGDPMDHELFPVVWRDA